MNEEFSTKRARVEALMHAHGLRGVLLTRSAGWSWATCGREANVATNSESAVSAVLFTPERDYVLADRIEMPRLLAEEVGDLPLEPVVFPWHEPAQRAEIIAKLAPGPVAADAPLPDTRWMGAELAALRFDLTAAEQDRMRTLGRDTGAAVEAATRAATPGMSEYELAGLLAQETFQRGMFPVVTLIATDERIHRFRHPSAGAAVFDTYAMLVLCARRNGLVASATRLVHVGPLPAELKRRARACARIDATVMAATTPGAALGDIFSTLQRAYDAEGFADEWRDHHQGGLAGYENREIVATPGASHRVVAGQAYAWNPSIAGVKSEDTMLAGETGPEIVSATGNWPTVDVQVGGATLARPAILTR